METFQDHQNMADIIVDGYAEDTRRLFITPGIGQALTYWEKSEEATDFAAAGYPTNVNDYPHIAAEAIATNKTPTEVANSIITKRSAWIAISARIEAIRLAAKQQIGNATTTESVDAIVQDAIPKFGAIRP